MAFKLNRDQLYSLAAKSSFGEDRQLAIDPESDPVKVAVKVRKNAPDSQRHDIHSNGWAYYTVNEKGHLSPIKEGS